MTENSLSREETRKKDWIEHVGLTEDEREEEQKE